MKLFACLLLAAAAGMVAAECPNACSGHGTCGSNDMCSCYRNWQAADCSERVCPYGISFTTTPQGDLNMDGDLYDASSKPIVIKSGTYAGDPILASVPGNSDQLTFNADVVASELSTGDCLMFNDDTYCITAVSSSAPLRTFTIDRQITSQSNVNNKVVYKWLETIAAPKGTWEAWPGHAATKWRDDGHFYMECSNQGSCDRSTGECKCFDGYGGRACNRATCPSDCSGNGRCMTVKDLSTKNPNRLSISGSTTQGSSFVATSADAVGSVSPGDRVYLGEQTTFDEANLYSVGQVSLSGFVIMPPARRSLRFGTTLYHAANYNLWDADKNMACLCDPGFSGYDCSSRTCPYGADPLDVTGEDYRNSLVTTSISSTFPKYEEKQTLEVDTSCGTSSGTIKLVHTDQHTGERLSTTAIEVNPELTSTVSVSEPQFIDGSGLTAQPYAGSTTYCATTATLTGCYKMVRFTPHLPTAELGVEDFIRIADEYRMVGYLHTDTTTGNYSYAMVTENFRQPYATGTFAYSTNGANAIQEALLAIPNGAVVSASVNLLGSLGQLDRVIEGGTSSKISFSAVATGSGKSIDPDQVCVGDMVRFYSDEYVRQILGKVNEAGAAAATGNVGFASATIDSIPSGITAGPNSYDDVGFRQSGKQYQIQTDIDGDQTELVCDTEGLSAVYFSRAAAYVTRAEPQKVWFVDPSYGSNQPYPLGLTNNDVEHPESIAGGDVIYVGGQKCEITGVDHSGAAHATGKSAIHLAYSHGSGIAARSAGRMQFAICKDPLRPTAHSTADEISVNDPLAIAINGATVSCSATDMRPLVWRSGAPSTAGMVDVTDHTATGDNRKVQNAAVASSAFADASSGNIWINQRVMIETQTGQYETRTIDSIDSNKEFFTVSKGFSAAHADKRMWLVGKGTKTSEECAGRGLCDSAEGLCKCFKGYAKQACQEQQALAA